MDRRLDYQERLEEAKRIEESDKRLREQADLPDLILTKSRATEDELDPGPPDPGMASGRSARSHPAPGLKIRAVDEADDSETNRQPSAQKKMEEARRAMEEAAKLPQQQQDLAKGVIHNIKTMAADEREDTQ